MEESDNEECYFCAQEDDVDHDEMEFEDGSFAEKDED